jgi:Bacterial SH3 domain
MPATLLYGSTGPARPGPKVPVRGVDMPNDASAGCSYRRLHNDMDWSSSEVIGLGSWHGSAARVSAIAVLAAAVLLVPSPDPVLAASCNGSSHAAPTLTNGGASPGSGTPSTTIRFSVRYRDTTGCAPTRIQVIVSGVGTYNLSGGSSYQSGVTFAKSVRLPAGRWSYRFTASSGSGAGARTVSLTAVSPTRVVISQPKPKPTTNSAPRPTPRPTTKPAAKPRATPRPSAAPGAATSSPSDSGSVAGAGTSGHPGQGSGGDPAAVDGSGRSDASAGGGASLAGYSSIGTTGDPLITTAILVWSLTTGFGVLLFALALRRLSPPESVPEGPTRRLAFPRRRSAEPAGSPSEAEAGAALPDVHLPRWLRPTSGSVGVPAVPPVSRDPIRFTTPPRKGVERSTVAYRLVRVSDGPDDHASIEIGRLDRGDEVEVIGDSEGYLKVRTPTGLEGWIPRMVLVG